jgi:hypothetical protein
VLAEVRHDAPHRVELQRPFELLDAGDDFGAGVLVLRFLDSRSTSRVNGCSKSASSSNGSAMAVTVIASR